MTAFKAGDRVRILEPSPITWHKPATILEVWLDSPDDANCIYRTQLDDGTYRRIRGRDLEMLEEDNIRPLTNGTDG
jgi:hypothetical protein